MKTFALLTATLVALLAVGIAAANSVLTGDARLHPYNQSGIKGAITFVDNGTTLSAVGAATGLDPSDFYISLLYDVDSVPGGPLACEPTPGSTLTEDQMFLGIWDVNADGNGTLVQPIPKTGPFYVGLQDIDTVSIRAESLDFDRVACGEISVAGGRK